jgi:hypothetical protein
MRLRTLYGKKVPLDVHRAYIAALVYMGRTPAEIVATPALGIGTRTTVYEYVRWFDNLPEDPTVVDPSKPRMGRPPKAPEDRSPNSRPLKRRTEGSGLGSKEGQGSKAGQGGKVKGRKGADRDKGKDKGKDKDEMVDELVDELDELDEEDQASTDRHAPLSREGPKGKPKANSKAKGKDKEREKKPTRTQ